MYYIWLYMYLATSKENRNQQPLKRLTRSQIHGAINHPQRPPRGCSHLPLGCAKRCLDPYAATPRRWVQWVETVSDEAGFFQARSKCWNHLGSRIEENWRYLFWKVNKLRVCPVLAMHIWTRMLQYAADALIFATLHDQCISTSNWRRLLTIFTVSQYDYPLVMTNIAMENMAHL